MVHGWDSSEYDYSCLWVPMDLVSISFHLVSVEDVVMFGVILIMLTQHISSSGLPPKQVFTSREFPQHFGVLSYQDLLGNSSKAGDAS